MKKAKEYLIGAGLVAATALAVIFRKKQTTGTVYIWPVDGRITSPYGARKNPVGGASEQHNGIDIGVPVGTPVKCTANGTVTDVVQTALGGKQVVVQHENNVVSGYLHLNDIMVQEGQAVYQGNVIAHSGQTGQVTGPHLHFYMKIAGKFVNPSDYLSA